MTAEWEGFLALDDEGWPWTVDEEIGFTSHRQCVQRELGAEAGRQLPAHDPAGEHVEQE
jgi:hypothetical protein